MKATTQNVTRMSRISLRTLVATLIPQFAFGLSYAWIALSPHAQQEGWSPVVVSAIFALTPLSSAITLLVGSRLPARFPLRRLCWIGVSLLVVGLAVAFLFPNQFTFLVFFAMLALGVGYGITLIASLAAIAHMFPRHVGAAGGMLTASYTFAAIAEVPVIGLLIPGHAWIDALRIAGTIVTVLAVIALTFMPAFPPSREQTMGGLVPLALLRKPRLASTLLLVISVAPLGTYATSQVGIYAQDLGLAAAVITAAVVLVAVGNTLGRLIGGMASDSFGINPVLLVIVILDVLAGVALWRTSNAPVLLVASGVVGLACGGLIGTVPPLAKETAPGAFNTASGLLFAGFALGGFIGPLVGAGLGGGAIAWLALGGLTTVGLLIVALHVVKSLRREPGVASGKKATDDHLKSTSKQTSKGGNRI